MTVLYDSREQKNQHILSALASMGVPTEQRKLDYGDYSFICAGRDFSLSCVIERKGSVDELYGNVMADRGRLEKELYAACQCAKQMTIIVEGVGSWDELKAYKLADWQIKQQGRKIKDIGAHVYSTLRAWMAGDRYRFGVEFAPDSAQTAAKMLEIMYYYWRSYKEMTAARR